MMKKVFAMLLTLVLVASLSTYGGVVSAASVVAAVPMTGAASVAVAGSPVVAAAAAPSSWAAGAVNQADSLGLLPSGLNNDYTRNITRAEFCALAVPAYEKAVGSEITKLRDFTDTTDSNVRKIGGLGIVQGVGNGAFNPGGDITRQEAAVILANLMSVLGKPLPASKPTFADNALIDSWAVAAVGQMQSSGIMAGTGNNNFTPKGDAGRYTREQSIVTLMRVWDKLGTATSQDLSAIQTGGQSSGNANEDREGQSRVLVTYFSCTGNTKRIAEYAADALGADIYEIKPKESYSDADLKYTDPKSRSSIEQNDAYARPKIDGSAANISDYDIIFVGYPIWWGEAPKIIYTFLESYDFSGKTIVPFCTSGSSGMGQSAENLQKICSAEAKWLEGRRWGSVASKADVAEWISGLKLLQ